MKYDYIHKFAGNTLKYWRWPLFFFIVSFAVAWYAANHKRARYCDEALVILGLVQNYLDREVTIEDPFVFTERLKVGIAGTDSSISGTVKNNIYAFELAKQRVVTVSLKGNDPHAVRVALKSVLNITSSQHDENYASAMVAYNVRLSYLKAKRINLEKIISTLSFDKSIPVEEYQNFQVELNKIKDTIPRPPTKTRIVMPESTEAKLCETKTTLEMLFFSLGWGFIGSLMAMFGLNIWTTRDARLNQK